MGLSALAVKARLRKLEQERAKRADSLALADAPVALNLDAMAYQVVAILNSGRDADNELRDQVAAIIGEFENGSCRSGRDIDSG